MKVVTLDTLKKDARERNAAYDLEFRIVGGRQPIGAVKFERQNGEMTNFDFEPGFLKRFSGRYAGEMLTTPADLYTFVQKSVIDIEQGRQEVPLLYQPIYRRQEDPNFTESIEVGAITSRAHVVFLEKLEGEEVNFGTRTLGTKADVKLATYAAGFEYTEDMVEYDKTWEVAELNRAFGEAYNALLNHIHLSPIIDYAYASTNTTDADATAGATFLEKMRATFKAAYKNQALDLATDTKTPRRGTILLTHSSNVVDIQEGLGRFVVSATEYPALGGVDTIIAYDGYSITVGDVTYTYPGCPTTHVFLIEPGRYFRELVKHDLRVDADRGDLTRLVAQEVVGRARRGIFASPRNAVEKIALPV